MLCMEWKPGYGAGWTARRLKTEMFLLATCIHLWCSLVALVQIKLFMLFPWEGWWLHGSQLSFGPHVCLWFDLFLGPGLAFHLIHVHSARLLQGAPLRCTAGSWTTVVCQPQCKHLAVGCRLRSHSACVLCFQSPPSLDHFIFFFFSQASWGSTSADSGWVGSRHLLNLGL